MSPEVELKSPPLGISSAREDGNLCCGDQLGRRSRACSSLSTATPETDIRGQEDFASGKRPFLKILMDAGAAANAAAIQLMSFKDVMDDEFPDPRSSASDKHRITRQRRLLLEKLEDFGRINKLLRQKLKQLQISEAERVDANHQINILRNKITQAEMENECLKRDVSEAERRAEELMVLRREEQENIKSAVHLTKNAEVTRAHLQRQLRNKGAENNRLTVQLRTLERTLTEKRMEIDDLKRCITSLTEKAAEDATECLRKARRAWKLRAERFEAAIEKCYEQLKEKDAQLANARLERESRKRQVERLTDERNKLVADGQLLKSQIADLTVKLQRDKDELTAANESVVQRIEQLTTENADFSSTNAALQESVTRLEQQLADCEAALVEEMVVSQDRKHQAEQCQHEVAALQAEIDDLRIKYANLLRETKTTQDGKDTDAEKVRQELQGRVEELKSYPELLSAAEQSLFECQVNLQRSERKCSEKSESIKQLQVKMESQTKLLRSSLALKESIHKANLQLREKEDSLCMQMDKLQQENLELVQRLAAQKEDLGYSNRQLDQRSSDCQALSRQLEAALTDVRQQVKKLKDQAASREDVLQTKILELETEKRRQDNELRLLHQSKHMAEKHFQLRLKDLQLSLDQSESHKQSIQNYVDFLKNSYRTMFDEINRDGEDVRKQMEGKFRTTAKTMVLQERNLWKREVEKLLDEKTDLQWRMSFMEGQNMKLKADFQWVSNMTGHGDQNIASLHKSYSAELRRPEEMGHSKVSQLEKEEQIISADQKIRALTKAHNDTLVLLSAAQDELSESKLRRDALEKKLHDELAEREAKHEKELSQREYSLRKELSDASLGASHELSELSQHWEARAQQWVQERRELEEMMHNKQKNWDQEEEERKEVIQRLTEENTQLQLIKKKKKKKKSFMFWRHKHETTSS